MKAETHQTIKENFNNKKQLVKNVYYLKLPDNKMC